MSLESGLRFFLRYVEAQGGVVLEEEDQALVQLPDALRLGLGLPRELAVTSDGEVAQEGGQMLVIAGHPLLEAAAERVLQQGDAGWMAVAWPGGAPPGEETLLEGLRAFYPVEHGRIDIFGRPEPVYVPLLRMGALVEFTGEGQFLERIETCVDAVEALPLPSAAAARLLLAAAAERPEACSVLAPRVAPALDAGLRRLEQRAAERAAELQAGVRSLLREERERAAAYYDAQLRQIARRRENAAADRQALYDEQARVTAEEALRRQAEIEEKFQVRGSVRPFRLHLQLAPALHLELEVRRGARCYPMACNFLLETQTFLPLRCPSCGEPEPLVAGRQELGCLRCQGARAEGPAVVAQAAPRPTPETREASGEQAPRAPAVHRPEPQRPPTGERRPAPPRDGAQESMPWQDWRPLAPMAQGFFNRVLGGGAPRVPVARHSPLDVALRWFGWRGLHLVLDLPYPDEPTQGCRLTAHALIEGHHLTGRLHAEGLKREFTLLTLGSADEATLWEVLPCRLSTSDRLAPLMLLDHQLEALEDMARRQGPPSGLDDAEWLLLAEGGAQWPFSILLRAVSIWRRVDRKAPGKSPRAVAAGLLDLALEQSGLKAVDGQVPQTFGSDRLRTRQAAEYIASRLPPRVL